MQKKFLRTYAALAIIVGTSFISLPISNNPGTCAPMEEELETARTIIKTCKYCRGDQHVYNSGMRRYDACPSYECRSALATQNQDERDETEAKRNWTYDKKSPNYSKTLDEAKRKIREQRKKDENGCCIIL